MILPDVNVLVHAHDSDSAVHERAGRWWDRCLAGTEGVGLAWVVMLGFVRIATHPRVLLYVPPGAGDESRVTDGRPVPPFDSRDMNTGLKTDQIKANLVG